MAAYEMMVMTPAIQNLIRENKSYRIDSSIQTGRKHGMFLLDESLFRLWSERPVRQGRSADAGHQAGGAGGQDRPGRDAASHEDEEEDEEDEDDDDEDDDEDDEPRRRRQRR